MTATVDFDADAAQDRATLQSDGFDKTIRLRFGDARRADLAFATGSADGGNLVAGDIDRDGDVDLVWVGSSTRDAVVLLNERLCWVGGGPPLNQVIRDLRVDRICWVTFRR